MKKKFSRRVALIGILALLVTMIPTSSFAATETPTATVKTTAVSKSAGSYSVKVEQRKMNYRTVNVTLPKIKDLKKTKVYKVSVTATMEYNGKVVKKHTKSVLLKNISSSTKTFDMGTPAYGKYTFTVNYLDKKGKKLKTVTLKNVGVIAEEYNMALLNGTFGPLYVSLNLWNMNKGEGNRPIPTTIALSRPDAYDWDKLPTYVYSNPLMTSPKSGTFVKKTQALSAYIADLYSLNKNSIYHIYLTDNYVKGLLELAGKNNLPEDKYDVTFVTDGSGTYWNFNSAFGGKNAQNVYERMAGEWSMLKKAYKKGAYLDCKEAKYAYGSSSMALQRYTYAVVGESENVQWWVSRTTGTFGSEDDDFLKTATSKMVVKDMKTMLLDLQARGLDKRFRDLYHFDNYMFADADKNGKKAMVLMGTRTTNERDFEEFGTFVKMYYGDEYEYYYKGHPATPTKLYPDKQAELDRLKIHDVESSIPAELILFYYPDVYCSGMSNSTLNASYKEGNTKAYFGTRIANKGSITGGDLFELFFTRITEGYEDNIKALCTEGHDSFLVEFKDTTKADIAVYDHNDKTIQYYKLDESGNYVAVK